MIDDLFFYYNQELRKLHELAEEFSKSHPKVAKHLNISHRKTEDPDVARMIEAFAFLTAQIQYKLDDSFHEIPETLLSLISPVFLSPIPSFSIIQLNIHPSLTNCYSIPKNTSLETISHTTEKCKFTTVYPVELWPIKIKTANLIEEALNSPVFNENPKSAIRIVIQCTDPKMKFSDMPPGKLIFFICSHGEVAYKIYTLLFKHTIAIGLNNQAENKTTLLEPSNIKPVGFNAEECLLPLKTQFGHEFNLLSEYLIFPEKFLFFELNGLDEKSLDGIANELEILFYFNEDGSNLNGKINKNTFKLGCTPIINLFEHMPEPINFDHSQSEYKIIADVNVSEEKLEMHSIKNVYVLNNDGDEFQVNSLYNVKYTWGISSSKPDFFWHVSRKINNHNGFEMYISFADIDYEKPYFSEGVVHIEALCTNANLPSNLPFGPQDKYLQLSGVASSIKDIECLMPFNLSIKPSLRGGALWKLISNFATNFLSFSYEDISTDMLKEILTLYNLKSSEAMQRHIDSITDVICKKFITRGIKEFRGAICQGMDVIIDLNQKDFEESELFLFGCVLDIFFAKYVTINSFTRLTFSVNKEVYHRWPIRMGSKKLL